jgi:hypothetical protein
MSRDPVKLGYLRPADLDDRQALLALGLLRLAEPSCDVNRWDERRRRVAAAGAGRAGFLTIEDQAGYLHALIGYAVVARPLFGRSLQLAPVIAAGHWHRLLGAMLRATAESRARAIDCDAIGVGLRSARHHLGGLPLPPGWHLAHPAPANHLLL